MTHRNGRCMKMKSGCAHGGLSATRVTCGSVLMCVYVESARCASLCAQILENFKIIKFFSNARNGAHVRSGLREINKIVYF